MGGEPAVLPLPVGHEGGNIGPPRPKRARLLNALPDIEASDSEDEEGESLEAMLDGFAGRM